MKALLIPIPIILCVNAFGQVFYPSTHPGDFKIDQSTISGQVSTLPYGTEMVEKSLLKYLRDYGRTEKMRGYFLTTDIENLTNDDFDLLLFSKVEPIGLRSQVWMGIDTMGLGSDAHRILGGQLEKLLLNFGRNVHVEHLQNIIAEAEQAAVLKSRDYQKLINRESILGRKLGLNAAERIRFEEALDQNAQEKVALVQRKELNLKLQKLATEELFDLNQNVDQLRTQLSDFQGTF